MCDPFEHKNAAPRRRDSTQRGRRFRMCKLRGNCFSFYDVYYLAVALHAELHGTGLQREEGVVAATAYVFTRVELGATLPDENFAGLDLLATESLHAKAF